MWSSLKWLERATSKLDLPGLKTAMNATSNASSAALTAVAFQDHWMRSLSLTDPLRPRNIPTKKKNWNKDAKPVVDTGLVKKNASKSAHNIAVEKEYVLDPKPPPLTLAQKLGLIDRPAEHLSEGDWQQVKQKSNERHDSQQPCVICKEDFGVQQQVLLSCSHVFHRNCLEAFERFSGKKTCPMCRKEQYEKRVIHEGAHEFRHKCATRIQAQWRGYVVRSWYKKLRETVPPNDPMLRKRFFEDKLKSITDRMVRSIDYDVNAFLREIDASVEASRDIFRHFDNVRHLLTEDEWEAIQLKAVERGITECPICLTLLEEQGYAKESAEVVNISPKCSKPVDNCKEKARRDKSSSSHRVKLLPKVKGPAERGGPLTGASDFSPFANESNARIRCKVLCSCSHVFHQTCLEAFEEFAIGDRKFICPVCRSRYQKKVL